MRPTGDPAALEARRKIAARLFAQGNSLTEVAAAVGSSVSSASRWRRAWKRRGEQGLAAKPPRAARFDLYCRLLDHNARTADVVQFLREVHRHLRRPIILVCDRLSVHRAAAKQLQRQHASWFSVEWLPPYAPELDPVENVWGQSKYGDLANFLPDDIHDLRSAVERLIATYRHDPKRLQSFFQTARLVY
jgi:transposase